MQIKCPLPSGVIAIACLLTCTFTAFSQDKNKNRFGKISPQDFETNHFEQDTGAHALILADVGDSDFESERDHLELTFKRQKRVKIIDKSGYDAATVTIPLYKSGQSEEKLVKLKATAYNLENGEVVETRLDSKNVFTDQQDKNHILKKFTFPAVKEGTIIEYTYTVTSPFYFNLQPWVFQDEYPCLWSEYAVTIPEFYEFIFLTQGYHAFAVNERENHHKVFHFTFDQEGAYGGASGRSINSSYNAGTTTYHWVAKEVPALKEESFTTSLYNHITRIEFQLSLVKFRDSPVREIMGTWPKVYEELKKHENFGAGLDKNNGYFGDEVDALTAGVSSDTAKARRIYNYVRDNFTCTDHSGLYMTKSLKSVFSSHNGNDADINLLLVAMLRRAKLDANPVILSTRQHGTTYQLYPLLNRFNYTIASVATADGVYYLDASRSYLGFGKLDASCYNGHARIISPEVTAVSFDADSLVERKFTTVFIKGENGLLKGTFEQRPTYFESCRLRGKIQDKGKEEYFKAVPKTYVMETSLSNTDIKDLDDMENPVMVKYDFEMQPVHSDMMYINPMFNEATQTNPFRSQERRYPVEMPYVMDEMYTLNMMVPEGYEVEEMPRSAMVKLNETDGLFQYLLQRTENVIQFRSRIKLSRANYLPEDYNSLRDFFDMIVKKQAEQIVLRKKK